MATYTLHAVHPFLFLIFPADGPLSHACMFISSSQEGASNDIERTLNRKAERRRPIFGAKLESWSLLENLFAIWYGF